MRFLSLTAAVAVALAAAPSAAPPRPRLIVLVSVDQFRADYVTQYGHQWSRGLRRLVDRGAWFSQATYPYMNTVTCVGHATISTGVFPHTHGMVLNEWWDRQLGKPVKCTADASLANIAHRPEPARGGDGPTHLRALALADELRLQSNVDPKIVTMSLKARAAITLAGRRATLATWFDNERGFVTSSTYTSVPVPFLQRFQAERPPEADAGKTWERTLPASEYLYVDDGPGEQSENAWEATFPHELPGPAGHPPKPFYEMWKDSPFADEYLARMAGAAVQEFRMGAGPGTDLLGISFSTLDEVGHDFGPRSHEVQDVLVRLDATLGRLLDDLDRLVGPAAYVLALTSDHGVPPLPQHARQVGLEGGRLDGAEIVRRVDEALKPSLGEGPHVETLIYTELYFKPGVYARLLQLPDAMKAAVGAIEGTPGVLRALRSDILEGGGDFADPVARAAFLSYVPGRSGDLLVIPRPFFISSTWNFPSAGRPDPTSHGTSYGYDTRVPIILAGPGIQPGEYVGPSSPADVAPTLGWMAGITMAQSEGRVLHEAFEPTLLDRRSGPTGAMVEPATAPGQAHR